MGKRIRLGLVYIWDKNWLGGKYYLQNLLIALNTLDDVKKPHVNLYCLDDDTFLDFQHNTNYPYLEKTVVKIGLSYRIKRKIVATFSENAALNVDIFPINPLDDVVFPFSIGSNDGKKITWIPDFQEKNLPDLFPPKELFARDLLVQNICKKGIPIVFSSYDSQNDFKRYYPEYAGHPTFVVHFAVNQLDISDVDINVLKQKYGITKPYLICPNQFWQHKNHLFLVRAFMKAVEKGLDLQLVCTGKMADYRNPEYINTIKSVLKKQEVLNNVLPLGVIDKKELLCLIKHSYAAIQPSLFEGWNTTVEDCKAMNKFIFLSDLPVHREQVKSNVCFFDPHNEDSLVEKLLSVHPLTASSDYSQNVRQFGLDFIEAITGVTNNAMN